MELIAEGKGQNPDVNSQKLWLDFRQLLEIEERD
jgi:hypothetical protein